MTTTPPSAPPGLVTPEDPGYDEARVAWNLSADANGACYRQMREAHLTGIRDTHGNTATITYATPIVSTALGVTLLGESLTWNQPAGALLVLTGVALVQGFLTPLPERPDPPAPATTPNPPQPE